MKLGYIGMGRDTGGVGGGTDGGGGSDDALPGDATDL